MRCGTDPTDSTYIEVDITNSSFQKLPIYLALGVPELWRYDGESFYMYQQVKDEYVVCEISPVFGLSLGTVIPGLLKKSFNLSERLILREFRQWVRK